MFQKPMPVTGPLQATPPLKKLWYPLRGAVSFDASIKLPTDGSTGAIRRVVRAESQILFIMRDPSLSLRVTDHDEFLKGKRGRAAEPPSLFSFPS